MRQIIKIKKFDGDAARILVSNSEAPFCAPHYCSSWSHTIVALEKFTTCLPYIVSFMQL
jgi:hypothetical protein